MRVKRGWNPLSPGSGNRSEPARGDSANARLPFLGDLEGEISALLSIGTADKLAAFGAAARFIRSSQGARVLEEVCQALTARGYPEGSARYELSLLPALFEPDFLQAIVSNTAALAGGTAWLDGELTEPAPGFWLTGFPIGPLLVVGSGNSLMPALVSTIESLVANCPVALRGSRVNQGAIESFFSGLRGSGDAALNRLLACVHPFYLDQRDAGEEALFAWLLEHGPFSAGIFWGGREALDSLVSGFARNTRHPRIIPMEPMTGVAVVCESFLDRDEPGRRAAVRGMARGLCVMGQQLCSSPTEAYFIGRWEAASEFAREVAQELENSPEPFSPVDDAYSLLLDRIGDRLGEAGSLVLAPRTGGGAWMLAVSHRESMMARMPADLRLPIGERRGFLEMIVVDSVEDAATRIRELPSAATHRGVRRVQTVVRLMEVSEAHRLFRALRATGIYRFVPPEYVVLRHGLEPLDGRHLISELTSQVAFF
jgi:hypothetical protein